MSTDHFTLRSRGSAPLRALFTLAFAFLLSAQLPAQTAPPSPKQPVSAQELVDQLIANAEHYRATLPSLTVHEAILSQTSDTVFFGKSTVQAEATMRVQRKTPGSEMEELRQITIVNGKPVAPNKRVGLPLAIDGGFGDFPARLFTTQHRPCFHFVLVPHAEAGAPLELSITPKYDGAMPSQCNPNPVGMTATARIDPASHQLIHLEQTFSEYPQAPKFHLLFISVDLAPIPMGQNTFWLPTALVARAVEGKSRFSFSSHYSDYHQFTATSTILPTTPE